MTSAGAAGGSEQREGAGAWGREGVSGEME